MKHDDISNSEPVICILKIKSLMSNDVLSYDIELLTKGIKNIPTILISYKYFNMCLKKDFKKFSHFKARIHLRGQTLVKFVKN